MESPFAQKKMIIYIYIYIWESEGGAMLETGVQSSVESYQRLKNWYLLPPCLTLIIIWYGLKIKCSNQGKGLAPFPTPRCSSSWKGSLRVFLNYGRQLYLYIYIYIYICVCVCVCVCVICLRLTASLVPVSKRKKCSEEYGQTNPMCLELLFQCCLPLRLATNQDKTYESAMSENDNVIVKVLTDSLVPDIEQESV